MVNYDYVEVAKNQFEADKVKIVKNSKEVRFQCPNCKLLGKTYNDYKLYLNIENGRYTCFRCGMSGKILLNGLRYESSNSKLVGDMILNLLNPDDGSNDISNSDDDLFIKIPGHPLIPDSYPWKYVIDRKIPLDDISYYNIYSADDMFIDKDYYGRIIIPNKVIFNNYTDIFTARSYLGSKLKYKNPYNSNKSDIVFNLHRIPKNVYSIILNEGVINSIIAGRNSVAVQGKYVSNSQLHQILAKNPEVLYISLDKDAEREVYSLCKKIRNMSRVRIKIVELPLGIDASNLGRDNYTELVNTSKEYKSRNIYSIEKLLNII